MFYLPDFEMIDSTTAEIIEYVANNTIKKCHVDIVNQSDITSLSGALKTNTSLEKLSVCITTSVDISSLA